MTEQEKDKETVELKIDEIIPYSGNPKKHPEEQINQIASAIKNYGYDQRIVVDEDNEVIKGHGRLKAIKKLGWDKVTVTRRHGLTEAEKKGNRLADNKVSETDYDDEELAQQIEEIKDTDHYDDYLDAVDEDEMSEYLDTLEDDNMEVSESQLSIPDDVKDWKILNLYAGIGGNARFWPEECDITHVEYSEEIAEALRKFRPEDEVVVADAHEFLLENFEDYDFIWSSPPCPTHSGLRKAAVGKNNQGSVDAVYPDMDLYQQILLLKGYFNGKWVVENVKSWYDPLIEPQEVGRHYYWGNFQVPKDTEDIVEIGSDMVENPKRKDMLKHAKKYGLTEDQFEQLPNPSDYPKDKILRNMVHPDTGEQILNAAVKSVVNNGV